MVTIKDYFDLKEIFEPSVYYEGVIELGNSASPFIGNPILYNCKSIHGKDGYQVFLEDNFFALLNPQTRGQLSALGKNNKEFLAIFKHLGLNLRIGYNPKTDKKGVYFSYPSFLFAYLINFLDGYYKYEEIYKAYVSNFLYEKVSNEEFFELVRNNLRERRKIFQDILKNGSKSEHYESVFNDAKTYITPRKNFSDVLKDSIKECGDFLLQARMYKDIFTKEINWSELLNIIDYDKLCLIIADYIVYAIDYAEDVSQKAPLLNILSRYFRAYESMPQKEKYNPMITIEEYVSDGKYVKRLITIKDVYQKYQDYLTRHPDIVIRDLDLERVKRILKSSGYSEEEIASFDPTTKTNYLKLMELQNIMISKQVLFAEWEFLPKEKQDYNLGSNVTFSNGVNPNQISSEEVLRRFALARNFIDNSNYRFVTIGKNKFLGYLAYIYPNGTVVLEKDMSQVNKKSDIDQEATYVMNLENFVELTKLPKLEIIKKMKEDPTLGTRVFHYQDMDRWIKRIKTLTSDNDYSPEVMRLIDYLVEKEELKRVRK